MYSVVVLHKLGDSLQQIEVVLELLLVFHEAMKASGKSWPLISEQVQDRCMQRLCARVAFIEGLTHELQEQASWQAAAEHPEQPMLAWTLGQFKDHGLLGIDTDVHKLLLLAALNLVECIADTRAGQQRGQRRSAAPAIGESRTPAGYRLRMLSRLRNTGGRSMAGRAGLKRRTRRSLLRHATRSDKCSIWPCMAASGRIANASRLRLKLRLLDWPATCATNAG